MIVTNLLTRASSLRCFSACFLLVLMVGDLKANENAELACALETVLPWKNVELNGLTEKIIDDLDSAVEGRKVRLYLKGGRVISVKSVYWGEVSRLEVDLYPDPDGDRRRHLVEITNYNYTRPIYDSVPEIASKITYQFPICEVWANYPNSADVRREYHIATDILESVYRDFP